jgi:glycosyltransferase involved in cell wall biosynthesis
VRVGLTSLGVAPNRITVNPYPVAAPEFQFVDRSQRDGPPVVGFIGQVGLRKGAPYFLEIARQLTGRARFVMVGPIAVSEKQRPAFSETIELPGPVPRSQVRPWLERFDIFLFPSTCEGSPSSVSEAMLTGLPVVTSPNSGTLVRHGVDGFVHAYDEIPKLTESVGRLIEDRELRAQMGRQSRSQALEHDLTAFAARLASVMRGVMTE